MMLGALHQSWSLSPDTPGQMKVLGHDCYSFGVDSAKISVFEKSDKVGFGGLLESQHCLALESDVLLELGGNLSNQSHEWESSYQ